MFQLEIVFKKIRMALWLRVNDYSLLPVYHVYTGTKSNVLNVEEQFLSGIYTPEFLRSVEPKDGEDHRIQTESQSAASDK